jgi:hypothetical protein
MRVSGGLISNPRVVSKSQSIFSFGARQIVTLDGESSPGVVSSLRVAGRVRSVRSSWTRTGEQSTPADRNLRDREIQMKHLSLGGERKQYEEGGSDGGVCFIR